VVLGPRLAAVHRAGAGPLAARERAGVRVFGIRARRRSNPPGTPPSFASGVLSGLDQKLVGVEGAEPIRQLMA
jgi:hypothetical protein